MLCGNSRRILSPWKPKAIYYPQFLSNTYINNTAIRGVIKRIVPGTVDKIADKKIIGQKSINHQYDELYVSISHKKWQESFIYNHMIYITFWFEKSRFSNDHPFLFIFPSTETHRSPSHTSSLTSSIISYIRYHQFDRTVIFTTKTTR